jgi:hypothetical protein
LVVESTGSGHATPWLDKNSQLITNIVLKVDNSKGTISILIFVLNPITVTPTPDSMIVTVGARPWLKFDTALTVPTDQWLAKIIGTMLSSPLKKLGASPH